MTDKAEFERLLDVYGFRCERFGQYLSTHARAQVVSAFAALASAPVAVRLPPRESENCGSSSAIAYAMAYNKALDDVAALNASAPVAGEMQPVAWRYRRASQKKSMRLAGRDPSEAEWHFAPHTTRTTEMREGLRYNFAPSSDHVDWEPLYAAPQASTPVADERQPVGYVHPDTLAQLAFPMTPYREVPLYRVHRPHPEFDAKRPVGLVPIFTAPPDAPLASAPVAGEARPVARIDNFGNVVMLTSDAPLNSYLHAAPQASAEDVHNAALDDAEEAVVTLYESDEPVYLPDIALAIRALKQPQADKDGGQQRAGDVRDTALSNLIWAASERDKGNRIRQFDQFMDEARAAISSNAAKQGSRDE